MPNSEKLQKQLAALSCLSGGGHLCTDESFCEAFGCGSCGFHCPAEAGMERDAGETAGCAYAHRRAVYAAEKFGGIYIYFCPAGLLFCVAISDTGEKKQYLFAGPINVSDLEDFVAGDGSVTLDETKFDRAAFAKFLAAVPQRSTEQVGAIAELLLAVALSHSQSRGDVREAEEKTRIQQQIGEYVQSIKSRLILGVDQVSPYPYQKERLLEHAIKTGNEPEANKYLNEILGHIFFASANNLDAIKLRAFELTVIISRAALDGGADESRIYGLSPRFISDFFALDSIDDICYALTKILKRFSEETFRVGEGKHADIMTQVASFVRNNYMHHLTLASVAEHVYLSPSYLSKIFNREMKMSFNQYLNEIRVEKSKTLLLSNDLSLTEIAGLVGFVDQSYFTKVFRKQTGMTPKQYRETGGEPQHQ